MSKNADYRKEADRYFRALFDAGRRARFAEAIRNYRCKLRSEDHEGLTGTDALLMAARSDLPTDENHVLTILCSTSLMNALRDLP